MRTIEDKTGFAQGDLLLVIADDKDSLVKSALGALRVECARRLNLLDPKQFCFAWITEFPMFEYSEEEGRFVAQHHPFCSPMDEDIPLLDGRTSLCAEPRRTTWYATDTSFQAAPYAYTTVKFRERCFPCSVFPNRRCSAGSGIF